MTIKERTVMPRDKNEANESRNESIVFQFAGPEPHKNSVVVPDENLKRFGGVYPLYKAFRQAFGDRLAMPMMEIGMLRMHVRAEEREGLEYGLMALLDDLESTAVQLRRNADLDKPLPFATAVRRPTLVAVLQAASRAYHGFGLGAYIETPQGKQQMPVLDPADFTQPEPDGELRKTGTFMITGLRRDDVHGHKLIVTENNVFVDLPKDRSCWAWGKIHDALESSTYLVGSLVRESKAHPWTPDPSARLEGEQEFKEVA